MHVQAIDWTGLCILERCCASGVVLLDAAKAETQSTRAPSVTEPPPLPQAAAEEDEATLERRVGAFVRAITRNPGCPGDSLVRWNTPICLLVAGLTAEDAESCRTDLSQISVLRGCAARSGALSAELHRRRDLRAGSMFSMSGTREINGSSAMRLQRRFANFSRSSQSRPVRVWYNIDWGRKSGTRNGHFVPSNARAESSAFVGNAIFDFLSIFAIIDTHRTEHTALDQLADYVAMAGLTNVDLDADFGDAPSILRLFAPSAEKQPSGLSRWDTAFLKALYQSDQTSRARRFEIDRAGNP